MKKLMGGSRLKSKRHATKLREKRPLITHKDYPFSSAYLDDLSVAAGTNTLKLSSKPLYITKSLDNNSSQFSKELGLAHTLRHQGM
jgi:hypothetical protein